MKSHASALLFCSSLVVAAPPSLPSFSEKLPATPPLSLSEAVRSGELGPVNRESPASAQWFRRAPPAEKRYVSRMPVIEPPADIDRDMPVTPKPGTDYKMTVKEPAVESVK